MTPRRTASALGGAREYEFYKAVEPQNCFVVVSCFCHKLSRDDFVCFLKTEGLGGDSAGPTILLLAPFRKDVKEVFAAFQAPSVCLLHCCCQHVSIAHSQQCIPQGWAGCPWSPSWHASPCFGPEEQGQQPLWWWDLYGHTLTHLPLSSPHLQVRAVPGAMSAPCRPCHGRL